MPELEGLEHEFAWLVMLIAFLALLAVACAVEELIHKARIWWRKRW